MGPMSPGQRSFPSGIGIKGPDVDLNRQHGLGQASYSVAFTLIRNVLETLAYCATFRGVPLPKRRGRAV